MVDAANIQLGGRRTRRAARGNDQQTEKDQEAVRDLELLRHSFSLFEFFLLVG